MSTGSAAPSARLDSGRLSQLVSEALRADSEDELFTVIARWLTQDGPVGWAGVALVCDDEPTEFELVAEEGGHSGSRPGERLALEGSCVGQAILTGRMQTWEASPDASQAEGPALYELGVGQVITAPLWSENRVVGSLAYAKLRGHVISQDDINLLIDVASIVSVNLERFRLLSRTRAELAMERSTSALMTDMTNVGVDLSMAASRDDVLQITAETLLWMAPVQRVTVGEVVNGETVRIVALMGDDDRAELGRVHRLDSSAFGQAVASGQMTVWDDLRSDDSLLDLAHLADRGYRAALTVPVPVQGRIGAALHAASNDEMVIGPDLKYALQVLANLAGAVLERVAAQEEAERRARSLDALIEDSPLLMLTVNADGTIQRSSRFGAEKLGRTAGEMVGVPLASLYVPEDRVDCLSRLLALVDSSAGTVDTWVARMGPAEGVPSWIRHTARRLAPEAGGPALLIVCEDITVERQLSEQLEREATQDPLTGLINRRELDRRLAALDKEAGPYSLCFIDVDHFKLINDTSGHRVGDKVLIELGRHLRRLVGPDDVLARTGGDEIVLLLPGCRLTDAVRVAQRLRRAARDLVFEGAGDHTHRVSLSIGVASLERSLDAESMLADADAACYAAKSGGRDRVSTVRSQVTTEGRRDGYWVEKVQRALDHGGLRLFGQAVVGTDYTGGPIRRFEVLLRLDDEGKTIAAGHFIPICERYGLVSDIDRWVVTELISSMVSNPSAWAGIERVSVNLSAHSVESEEFLEFLIDALSAPGLVPTKITIELTETVAMTNFQTASRFMESVSALGCTFALDDFGTGFATYNYLKRLPLHLIKIDGSLIEDLATDRTDQAIVRSITQVAQALGLRTVAERVEKMEDLRVLSALGVDYGQGYAIGLPSPIEELLAATEADPATPAAPDPISS